MTPPDEAMDGGNGWQPIETAPKDKQSAIDLWCVDPDGEFDGGIRLVDIGWHEADGIFPHTGWVRVMDDGDWDLVEGQATSKLGLPPWRPTHWMLRPNPPASRLASK